MTPLAWMWTLSIAGAMLFFGAGMLARRPAAAADRGGNRRRAIDLDPTEEVTHLARPRPGHMALAAALPSPTGPIPVIGHAIDRDLAVELDTLRRRAADLDELRSENDQLRGASLRAEQMSRRVSELEREVDFLRHEQATARLARPVPPRTHMREGESGSALEALLADLRMAPGVTGAVISDELGLLVAGPADSGVQLAAAGGYLSGVGARTRELLAMGPAARILVEDDAGNAVTATPMPGAATTLVAVVVTGSSQRSG